MAIELAVSAGTTGISGRAGKRFEITGNVAVTPFPFIAGSPTIIDAYLQDENKRTLQGDMKSLGVNRIRVSGLNPDTNYYYRVISHGATETSQWPATVDPPLSLKTATSNRFISGSTQVVVTLEGTGSKGWVVIAASPDASYPVSGVVGDGARENEVYLDLTRSL